MVNAIPDNYPRVSPYLRVKGAAAAIDFYIDVFGFTERGASAGDARPWQEESED